LITTFLLLEEDQEGLLQYSKQKNIQIKSLLQIL